VFVAGQFKNRGRTECTVGWLEGRHEIRLAHSQYHHFYVFPSIAGLRRVIATREPFQKVKIGTGWEEKEEGCSRALRIASV
jgi:hypothetical protein